MGRTLLVLIGSTLMSSAGCRHPQHGGNSATNPADTQADDDTATGGQDTATAGDDSDPVDNDGDGFDGETDCDDTDPTVYPGAPEICGDGLVNDCSGSSEEATAFCRARVSTADAIASWHAGFLVPLRLAGVGDLDGDGLDDVVKGISFAYGESEEDGSTTYAAGELFVYRGPVSGDYRGGDQDQLIKGTARLDAAGWDLTALGDVNGDGFDDFAVGASDSGRDYASGTPAVYRVDGPAEIGSMSEATAILGDDVDFGCLGATMAALPDLDGDGAADLLVADWCRGEVHLVSGAATQEQQAGVDDLATYIEPTGLQRFGLGMAGGDFDGDGLSDVAIGAPQYSFTDWTPELSGLGFVSVFAGAATGVRFAGEEDVRIQATTSDSVPNDIEDRVYVKLGASVAAGDLDGDGYDDLVAGAPHRDDDTQADWPYFEGGSFVFLGPLSASLGIPDADFSLTGDWENCNVGGETVADQDLDGDGQVDLLIGNGWTEVRGGLMGGDSRSSHAWVVFGPVSAGTRLAADADVVLMDDADVTTYPFGMQARVAGDTDGDGLPELLVGGIGDWAGLFRLPDGEP